MVDQTPRFELDDFEPGDTNWDHSDLVQFVDEHGIERAPITERPTEGTYPDELFLATDEGILYRWDADAESWVVELRSGLSEGEDFDGQGSSSFTNLESVGADALHSESLPTIRVGIENRVSEPVYVAWGPDGEIARDPDWAHPVIQAAHDELPDGTDERSGGHIHIQRGDYPCHRPYPETAIHILKDNVTITGEGAATRLYAPDGASADTDGIRFIDVGGRGEGNDPWTDTTTHTDNFTIKNIAIDGNQQNNGGDGDGNTIDSAYDGHNLEIVGSDPKVINIWSINSTGDGVELTNHSGNPDDTQGGQVIGSTFKNCWEQCIHIHGHKDAEVIGNYCDGEVNNGVFALHSGDCDTIGTVITGNHFLNGQTQGALLSAGNTGNKARDILFADNVVKNCDGNGVEIRQGQADEVTVRDNKIIDGGSSGIFVSGGEDLIIEDNEVKRNATHGINVQNNGDLDVTIEGNQCIENNTNDVGGSGIRVTAKSTSALAATVTDNTTRSDPNGYEHNDGIMFLDQADAAYGRVTCIGNDVDVEIDDRIGVLRRDNVGDSDFVSAPPSTITPTEGEWYLDDGTNTGSGTPGKRVYDGSAWQDAWTL